MRDRIAALQPATALTASERDDRPAIDLISSPEAQNESLLVFDLGLEPVVRLRRCSWEDVAALEISQWRQAVASYSAWLRGFTANTLPVGRNGFSHAGLGLFGHASDVRVAGTTSVLAAGLAISLMARQWALHTGPGQPAELRRGNMTLQPFAAVAALARGELSAEGWRKQCEALGITGWALADGARAALPASLGGSARAVPGASTQV